MGLIIVVCFFVITLTVSIAAAMLPAELLKKGGLSAADPVHMICLAQVIFAVSMVAGLLILEGVIL